MMNEIKGPDPMPKPGVMVLLHDGDNKYEAMAYNPRKHGRIDVSAFIGDNQYRTYENVEFKDNADTDELIFWEWIRTDENGNKE